MPDRLDWLTDPDAPTMLWQWQNGLVVDEWRRLDTAVQEEWRGALAEAAAKAQASKEEGAVDGGEGAMEGGEVEVVPPYLDFDPSGQRPPRPLRKPPQLTTTVRS